MGEKEPYIPAKYQQVEYLQGDRNAYIRTNFSINFASYNFIELEFDVYAPNGADARFFFSTDGGEFLYSHNASNIVYRMSDGWRTMSTNSYDEFLHVIMNKDTYSINYQEAKQYGYTQKNYPKFCLFYSTAASKIGNHKLGAIKYTQNNVLIFELIPCYRKADFVAGMYDRVNDVFYTNAGTGAFIVGPDIN
jgi:hypothetical protein